MVIAIIAILAALLLPAVSRAKDKAWDINCRSDLKQLTTGWLLYLDDSNGVMPYNNGGSDAGGPEGSWVRGNAREDLNTTNIEAGVIYRYVGNPRVYKCPADRASATGTTQSRVRSYGIEGLLGAPQHLTRFTQIVSPAPALV